MHAWADAPPFHNTAEIDDPMLVSSSSGTTTAVQDDAAATVTEPMFYQPTPEAEEGADGPFWRTSFGVVVPEGHWETGDGYDCHPVAEGEYRLETNQGVMVAAFDLAGSVVFGRTDSQIQGSECQVMAAVMGDYNDDLGNSYSLSNGALTATFTPEELFSGQGDGPDIVKSLG